MSTDKIVTHADLNALRALRSDCSEFEKDEQRLLDRLIAAAEADAPTLPEPEGVGSVVRATCVHDDTPTIFVKRETDSWIALPGQWDRTLQQQSDCWEDMERVEVLFDPDRLSPLRPTVTEADVEKAARAAHVAYRTTPAHIDAWVPVVRAAFKAAGIEVQP